MVDIRGVDWGSLDIAWSHCISFNSYSYSYCNEQLKNLANF